MSVSYNYFITEEEQEQEYLQDIQNGKISPKFRFIGEAQMLSWLNLWDKQDNEYYNSTFKFFDSIKSNIVEYINSQEINLISIGGINDERDKILLEEFIKNTNPTYNNISSSQELIKNTLNSIAKINISKNIYVANLSPQHIKRASTQIKKNHNNINFFSVLNNTFGIYPQEYICKCLRDAMDQDDYLLLDVHLSPDVVDPMYVQTMLRSYTRDEFKHHMLSALSPINLTLEHGVLELEYISDKFFTDIRVVKYYFRFNQNKIIKYMGENIYFSKNERILVFTSNKYSKNTLFEILTGHGFRIKKKYINNESSATLLCQLA